MIKANELRIGNWVEIFNPHHPEIRLLHNVTSINEDGINLISTIEYGASKIEAEGSLNPIPLTPEILEQCGFTKRPQTQALRVESDYGSEFLYFDGKLFLQDCDGGNIGQEIKYLHQLQNLYYALTYEELQVNIHDKTQTT